MVGGWAAGEFGGDYAEALFELGEVPAFAAEDADFGFGASERWGSTRR